MASRFIPLLLAAFICTASAEEYRRSFDIGVYKQEGTCSELFIFGKESELPCRNYLGVLVRRHDRPEFMVGIGDRSAILFKASGPPSFSRGNTLIRYPIDTVMNLANEGAYEVEGECILRLGVWRHDITCESWIENDRQKRAFSFRFIGDSVWMYKPRW